MYYKWKFQYKLSVVYRFYWFNVLNLGKRASDINGDPKWLRKKLSVGKREKISRIICIVVSVSFYAEKNGVHIDMNFKKLL